MKTNLCYGHHIRIELVKHVIGQHQVPQRFRVRVHTKVFVVMTAKSLTYKIRGFNRQ